MARFETLVVGDSTTRMYVAGDGFSGTPGVLVLHAWWGLNDDIVAFADRLATAGFTVGAPDLYGGGQVAATIEDAERLSGAAEEAQVDATVLAAVDSLVDRLGPTAPLAALGFSFGAHWAMWAPTERDRIAATVLYYGTTGGSLLEPPRLSPSSGTSPRTTRMRPMRASPSSRKRSGEPAGM